MQISVESLSSIKKKINFEIPAERVASEVEKAYEDIRKYAAIKGFRKGKVPKDIIKKHYHDKMAEDVLKNLVNDTYFKALTDEKIHPVSYPVIDSDELKVGEALKYSATVEVFPEITPQNYSGLAVKKEKFVINDDIVGNRLHEIQESMSHLKPAEDGAAAKSGNFVTLDFEGSIDGVPFEGGADKDHELELGAGRFIPGFEDQLIGMKSGDEGEVKVTFPEDYREKDLAGKDAVFAVKIKEIKIKELPELSDDFAKDVGEFESLEDLRKKIAEVYTSQENERIEGDLRDNLMKMLVENNSFDVPDVLVDRQLNLMLENSKRRLARQRFTLDLMGLTDETYKTRFRSTAESQVKGSLLLDAIADKEGIEIADTDVEERIKRFAAQDNQDIEQIEKIYQKKSEARENLIAQLREEKTIDFLMSKAIVTEVERDELK